MSITYSGGKWDQGCIGLGSLHNRVNVDHNDTIINHHEVKTACASNQSTILRKTFISSEKER
jgi:hypothetical protein